MNGLNHVDMPHNLWQRIKGQHGFLKPRDVAELTEVERLRPVLVRCGCGRFSCPAQDAQHFIDIITAEGSDYVRDVSLPGGAS